MVSPLGLDSMHWSGHGDAAVVLVGDPVEIRAPHGGETEAGEPRRVGGGDERCASSVRPSRAAWMAFCYQPPVSLWPRVRRFPGRCHSSGLAEAVKPERKHGIQFRVLTVLFIGEGFGGKE